jgi:hypothetical protein
MISEETLIYSSDIELHGDMFQIKVYCRSDGHHFAQTHLGNDDIIINDGFSLEEVLAKHQRLLPLALGTRKLNQSYRGFPRRYK